MRPRPHNFFVNEWKLSFIAAAILVPDLVLAVMATALEKLLILEELFLVVTIFLDHRIREYLLRCALLVVDRDHIVRASG